MNKPSDSTRYVVELGEFPREALESFDLSARRTILNFLRVRVDNRVFGPYTSDIDKDALLWACEDLRERLKSQERLETSEKAWKQFSGRLLNCPDYIRQRVFYVPERNPVVTPIVRNWRSNKFVPGQVQQLTGRAADMAGYDTFVADIGLARSIGGKPTDYGSYRELAEAFMRIIEARECRPI
jgi:hypothetical protein